MSVRRLSNYQMQCGENTVIIFFPATEFHAQFMNYFSLENQRFPFDTKNPTGFPVGIAIQYIQAICPMVAVKCFTICGFGTCALLFPLTKDIKNALEAINANAKRKKTRSKIVKQFAQFIQFHSKSIQLSHVHICKIVNRNTHVHDFLRNAMSTVEIIIPFHLLQIASQLFRLVENIFRNHIIVGCCCNLCNNAVAKDDSSVGIIRIYIKWNFRQRWL